MSGRPVVVVTRRLPEAVERELARDFDARLNQDDRPLGPEGLMEALRGADAVLCTVTDRLTADVLAAEPRRAGLLANFGVGFNHIDTNAAKARGIAVSNTPDVLTEATADIAMTLLLMVTRRAGEGERHLRTGAWTGWRPTHMLGIMPGHIYMQGKMGLITRSGTLGYEAASQMKALGIGISTSVGIGGDPINGSSFLDHLKLFEQDPETEAVMIIGEIGGPQEAEAALYAKEHMSKPVIGYVAGLTAPKGRRMGHAGAIISAFGDTAAEKAEMMRMAGLTVAPSAAELGATVKTALKQRTVAAR